MSIEMTRWQLIIILAAIVLGFSYSHSANADCFIFCSTSNTVTKSPPPYNATLIRELSLDHERTDTIIKSSDNDNLKQAWASGKTVDQLNDTQKLDLQIAAKKYDDFIKDFDAGVNSITDKLRGLDR